MVGCIFLIILLLNELMDPMLMLQSWYSIEIIVWLAVQSCFTFLKHYIIKQHKTDIKYFQLRNVSNYELSQIDWKIFFFKYYNCNINLNYANLLKIIWWLFFM